MFGDVFWSSDAVVVWDRMLIDLLQGEPVMYWIIVTSLIIATTVPICLLLWKFLSFSWCKHKWQNFRNQDKCPRTPANKFKIASPSKQDIENDILNELDRYHSTKGRDIEGLTASIISSATNTTPRSINNEEYIEKIASLEQELSNQKLLNHYTELRLNKKEKECDDLKKLEENQRSKIKELMNEISSISTKNVKLMSYCKTKMRDCKNEYDKLQNKHYESNEKNKNLEKEISSLKNKLSGKIKYKTECTKLRANVSTLKSQIRENNKTIQGYKKDIKHIKNTIETQKHRLNDNSRSFNKMHDDLVSYKAENKKLRILNVTNNDKIKEFEIYNQELLDENDEIKHQISKISQQLKQQSLIQNEIIDIQQQLTKNKKDITSSISVMKLSPPSVPKMISSSTDIGTIDDVANVIDDESNIDSPGCNGNDAKNENDNDAKNENENDNDDEQSSTLINT